MRASDLPSIGCFAVGNKEKDRAVVWLNDETDELILSELRELLGLILDID